MLDAVECRRSPVLRGAGALREGILLDLCVRAELVPIEDAMRPLNGSTVKERLLLQSIPVTESGCWIWMGNDKTAGYGRFYLNKKKELVHRVSYEVFKGHIPDGLTIDHLCRVRCCINPDHLQAVTFKENILRGTAPAAINARKKTCQNGHLLDEANTYCIPSGGRSCRACDRLRYYSNKEVVLERRADYYRRNAEKVKARTRAYRERKKREVHNL